MFKLGSLLYVRIGLRARKPTRYQQEQRELGQFLRELNRTTRSLIPLLQDLALQAEEAPGSSKRNFTQLAESDLTVKKWLDTYSLKPGLHSKLITRLSDLAFKKKNQKQTHESLRRLLEPAFIETARSRAQQPLHEVGISPDIIKRILPSSFTVSIGPGSKIVEEFSVFGNKLNTIERKSQAMAQLLSRWNELVARLNEDLESSDPLTQLSALVASIVVSTGIRPGAGGLGKLKTPEGELIRDEEGRPVRIDTVGATGLRPDHVQFVRDDFARLEFPGKSGTINIATLDNPTLVKVLKNQIESARADDPEGGLIFVTKDGESVTPTLLNSYFKSIVGQAVSASDFRKLKATQVFYDSLKERKDELRAQLGNLKQSAIASMRESIVSTVLEHLEDAAKDVQRALSHETIKTTIESYISPRVVLYYLTNAGLPMALEHVVGSGHNLEVKFDPIDFYNRMRPEGAPELKAARLASTVFMIGDSFTPLPINETLRALNLEEVQDG